jgi:ABC-2 type transport system ATP-binding protein
LDEADQLADDIVVIDHGKVIAHGTSGELKDQIGGDRLEITLENADQATQAINALSPIVSGEATIDGNRYSAPVSGGSPVLIDAVRALDSQGIGVADIGLRRPTLDDVFLTLTGHGAEEDQRPEPSTSRRGRRGARR